MKSVSSKRLPRLACFLILIAGSATAEMYPFRIDMDALTGPPVSVLNEPITDASQIHVRNGHFYTVGPDLAPNTGDDRRVRFWGLNLTPSLTFPRTPEEAERLARRFEKMGVNAVRLFGMDLFVREEYYDFVSLLAPGAFPRINRYNWDKLDLLVRALRDHGIYVVINFKSHYQFTPADCYPVTGGQRCVPDPAALDPAHPERSAKPMPGQSKPLDLFNRDMRFLQKWYITQILDHVNPYTGRAYKNDPTVALLEFNNENSLINTYRYTQETLPPLYAAELDVAWNNWLRSKYGTTEALRAAWAPAGSGVEMLTNGDFSDGMTGWTVVESSEFNGGRDIGSWDVVAGEFEVTVNSPPPGADWLFNVGQRGLPVEDGKAYVLSLTASADIERDIKFTMKRSVLRYDWTDYVFGPYAPTVRLTPTRTPYKVCFVANQTHADARLFIYLGAASGKIRLDDVSLQPADAANSIGLATGEDLGSATVQRLLQFGTACPTPARANDYAAFLTATERDYYQELKNYVKNARGAKQPVTGSQGQGIYGGLIGNKNMSEVLDYVDAHHYWDHPRWATGQQWSATDWFMRNTPMSAYPSSSVLNIIATSRSLDKPFTISEFAISPLNRYAVEGLPIAAAYGALQDIDGIFLYEYFRAPNAGNEDGRDLLGLGSSYLMSWFNVMGNPAYETLMSTAANIFRRADVAPARDTLNVKISDFVRNEQIRQNAPVDSILLNANYVRDETSKGFDVRMGLRSRAALAHVPGSSGIVSDPFPVLNINWWATDVTADTGELRWVQGFGGVNNVRIDSPRTKGIVGMMGDFVLSGVRLTGNSGKTGAVILSSTDGRSLATSSDILVTTAQRAVNSNGTGQPLAEVARGGGDVFLCHVASVPCPRAWNERLNTPLLVESNPVTITLSSAAPSLAVDALGADGRIVGTIPVTNLGNGTHSFVVGADGAQTPWYRVRAAQPPPTVIEAESAQSITGNSTINRVVASPGASGGRYVQLPSNGVVTLVLPDALPGGDYYLEIRARGMEHKGAPEVAVAVDGTPLGTVPVPETIHNSWQWFQVGKGTVSVPAVAGRRLTLSFANDYWEDAGKDRNLYIDFVSLVPAR